MNDIWGIGGFDQQNGILALDEGRSYGEHFLLARTMGAPNLM